MEMKILSKSHKLVTISLFFYIFAWTVLIFEDILDMSLDFVTKWLLPVESAVHYGLLGGVLLPLLGFLTLYYVNKGRTILVIIFIPILGEYFDAFPFHIINDTYMDPVYGETPALYYLLIDIFVFSIMLVGTARLIFQYRIPNYLLMKKAYRYFKTSFISNLSEASISSRIITLLYLFSIFSIMLSLYSDGLNNVFSGNSSWYEWRLSNLGQWRTGYLFYPLIIVINWTIRGKIEYFPSIKPQKQL